MFKPALEQLKYIYYQPYLICCNLNNTTTHILVKHSRFISQKTSLYWLQYSKYSEIPQIRQISKWQNSSLTNWTKFYKCCFEYVSPYTIYCTSALNIAKLQIMTSIKICCHTLHFYKMGNGSFCLSLVCFWKPILSLNLPINIRKTPIAFLGSYNVT